MAEEELPEIEPMPLEEDVHPEPLPTEEEPISLTDEPTGSTKIKAFGGGQGEHSAKRYKRPLNLTGAGATRCRIFHSKIAPNPMEYLENQVNEWLDANEIEVKFVTQVVGVLEGKTAEPNLIVMVWY